MGQLTRLLAGGIVSALLMSCSGSQPELAILYKTSQHSAKSFPVILVYGAFGGRLCAVNGSEHWPGSLVELLFDDYRLLARGWSGQSILALEEYVGVQLERARRFVWSLTVSNPGSSVQLIVFGGDCVATPARIIIEDIGDESYVRLWPAEIKQPDSALDYPCHHAGTR